MTSGCRGTPYFRIYDRELVSKNDFVKVIILGGLP